MSEANWTEEGATLSHKNACKEFGLTEQEIIEAMRQGKLQYRENYAHGNPYCRVLRAEVLALIEETYGSHYVEEQKLKHQLSTVTREINSHKRKLTSLEKQRAEIIKLQNELQAL